MTRKEPFSRERLSCDGVMARSSYYLDRRLKPQAHEELEAHLEQCDGCRRKIDALIRLGERVRALPKKKARPDLASRVRLELGRAPESLGLVKEPRPYAETGRRMAVAAAVVLICGLAYVLGRQHGESGEGTEGPRLVSETPSVDPWGDQRPRGFHPEAFVRATKLLAADLAVIDRLETSLRRPLIEAQLEHFGLREQADLCRSLPMPLDKRDRMHALADFVVRVDRAGDLEPPVYLGLMEEVRSRSLPGLQALDLDWPKGLSGMPAGDNLNGLVHRLGASLPSAHRDSLMAILSLRDQWVRDRSFDPSRVRILRSSGGQRSSPFDTSLDVTMVTALMEATGRHDERRFLLSIDSPSPSPSMGVPSIREALELFLHERGVHFEAESLQIVEESDGGGTSVRISVRSSREWRREK